MTSRRAPRDVPDLVGIKCIEPVAAAEEYLPIRALITTVTELIALRPVGDVVVYSAGKGNAHRIQNGDEEEPCSGSCIDRLCLGTAGHGCFVAQDVQDRRSDRKEDGPSTMPNTPNTCSPPSSEKNITSSLSPTRPPTSLGLRKLSTVLITAVPNTARMIAHVQCPVAARYTAPGAQTPAAPTTGSTLVTTVTMPHSAAEESRGSRRSRRRAHPGRPR